MKHKDQTLRLNDLVDDREMNYSEAYRVAAEELAELGIAPASQVVDCDGNPVRPELPRDGISCLNRLQILNLLGQYAAWLEFVSAQAAAFSVQHAGLERRKAHIKAQLRIRSSGHAGDKTDAATTNPTYIEADLAEYTMLVKKEMSEAIVEGAQKAFFTVSRAITSQGQERDRVDREQAVAPKRSGSYGVPNIPRRK
jgi:hypothetical protein